MNNSKYKYLKEMTVLYVEDDTKLQEKYSMELTKHVKGLYLANDGQDGYDKYIEYKPNIIITDLHMPILCGLDMVKKIRQHDEDIAIFITTEQNDASIISKSLFLRICGYLVKPIDINELLNTLDHRAKSIIADTEKEIYMKMLQLIINADGHMLAVTDLETISFANETFKNFMNIQNIDDFNTAHENFTDIFLQRENYLHNGLLDSDDNFMELMLQTEQTKRNVLIFDYNLFQPKAFHFTLTPLDMHDNKNIYLAGFVDISYMELEKIAIENKAYYDNLTKIYNRNKIDEVFKDLLPKSNRYDSVFSIILIDIDHFKNFNDMYGHLIGDEVLVLLAKTISKITRDTDTFARWGGEEFLVILPYTTKENTLIVAEHFRKCISNIKHPIAGGITASFGITEFKADDTQESMYKRCDDALYIAKENGRNRVEIK